MKIHLQGAQYLRISIFSLIIFIHVRALEIRSARGQWGALGIRFKCLSYRSPRICCETKLKVWFFFPHCKLRILEVSTSYGTGVASFLNLGSFVMVEAFVHRKIDLVELVLFLQCLEERHFKLLVQYCTRQAINYDNLSFKHRYIAELCLVLVL